MGTVYIWPGRGQLRASQISRAAKRAKRTASTPADRAGSVDKTADHQSAGMLLRLNHLMTDQLLAPTSAAMASREGQSSMIERNDLMSDMPDILGQSVPKIKAVVSHDLILRRGQNVPMAQDDEDIAESLWREGFRARLKEVRGERTQDDMADLLGISRDAYSKYEGKRASAVPTRLLPKIAKIGAVSLEWLITGEVKAKASHPVPVKSRKEASR